MGRWVYTFGQSKAEGSAAMRELLAGNEGNVNHYVFPPDVRARFDETQTELPRWMEWQRTSPAGNRPELMETD